jgi:hypothetical protein
MTTRTTVAMTRLPSYVEMICGRLPLLRLPLWKSLYLTRAVRVAVVPRGPGLMTRETRQHLPEMI